MKTEDIELTIAVIQGNVAGLEMMQSCDYVACRTNRRI